MKLEQLIETQQLAKQLMTEHGLTQQGWTFRFANDKRTVGWCRFDSKSIEVSKHYLDSHPDSIRDTILHEIAHALVGSDHGHDHVWRMKCIEIGANPTRTTDKAVFNGDYNYTVTCQNDGCPRPWSKGKHRIKQGYYSYHCRYCLGSITIINLNTGEITHTSPSRLVDIWDTEV